MPIYEYDCRRCGTFEYSQSIREDPLKRCPTCRSAVTKLLSASSFHLKGGGWYSDGYAKKSADSGGASSNGSGGSDSPASADGGAGNDSPASASTAKDGAKSSSSGSGESSKKPSSKPPSKAGATS